MRITFLLVAFVSSFLLAAVALLIVSAVLNRRRETAGEGLVSATMEIPAILKSDRVSSITLWGRLLERFDYIEILRARIAEADMTWSVGRLTASMLLAGSFAFALLWSIDWMPFWIVLPASAAAAWLPYGYVLRRRARRFVEFERQFPDALDFLARSLRAGHPIAVSLEMLVSEETPPLATEIRKTVEERRLGMPLDAALDNLSRRVPLLNVRLFVAAVKLQSRAGGRLSDVLTSLAEGMREAAAIEGEVRALAAHGKVTGSVLTTLPFVIAAMMTFVNPGYLNILTENPTGRTLIVVCLVALVAAHIVIRKIVDIRP
jgi:tight adherence protein B